MRYAEGMHNHHAIELPSGRFSLLIAPDQALERLLDPVANLAWLGPLRILDGGNRFNVYHVARHLERRRPAHTAPEIDLHSILANIQVARAFTCYQVVALLSDTPSTPAPTLVLDMLATFADETVHFDERRRLLSACLLELHRLSRLAPLGVSVRLPHPEKKESVRLLAILEDAADQVYRYELPVIQSPPRLF